jgi:hypothetical protein
MASCPISHGGGDAAINRKQSADEQECRASKVWGTKDLT